MTTTSRATLSLAALTAITLAISPAYTASSATKPKPSKPKTPISTYQPPTPTSTVASDGTVRINSDQHDGTVTKIGSTYYLYGTAYGCGFTWRVDNTPWCGLWASSAPSLAGPWTQPVELFSPSATDPWSGLDWQDECASTGNGCFNARMLTRTGWGLNDGVNILWFNSPKDASDGSNAYNAMGCTGPLGPCGPGAPVYGSYKKPSLYKAYGNGDFGFINSGTPGQSPTLVSAVGNPPELNTEQIDQFGNGGVGNTSGGGQVAAFSGSAEGVGGWYDTTSGKYVMTYSDPQCGYCAGAAAGFATSGSAPSGWSEPGNVGFNPPPAARRDFSSGSCGGQPRTVTVLNSQPYEDIDVWTGAMNETSADTLLVPLTFTPNSAKAGDGQPYTPPVQLGSCS